MRFCIHCGQEVPDSARFCQKCGKATAQDGIDTTSAIGEISSTISMSKAVGNDSIGNNNMAVLAELAVGLGILIFMFMLGATSKYPNNYVRFELEQNTTVLLWYGILYGFAIRAISTIRQKAGRVDWEYGIGGAIIGLAVTIPGYMLYFSFPQNPFLHLVWLFTAGMVMPVAKSVLLVVGSGIRFNGVHGIKRNLLISFISSIIGWMLILVIDYMFREATLYVAFGLFGFINYIALLRFAKNKKPA
ncbi:zinc ribbon domain-containing protein [Sporomusa sphaeroides]|uniref:Zinc-ribbon domain-containing protein n=1 Tax=Sporomusa sphaeroides DSM 2875 TaxID=1337886 RepID=A0ABM9W0E6_9FIRM|nr:zinc ribbon domain-containing protein [Sporomusa sphaeroides]OLS56322.1 hypothetical protein SPSPH_27150 [Sporomusa sphaeroides DSM 2875]CVK18417.1 hypothetical protein SSPH_01055 [Sporomusa sphaeroides DSM 2875]